MRIRVTICLIGIFSIFGCGQENSESEKVNKEAQQINRDEYEDYVDSSGMCDGKIYPYKDKFPFFESDAIEIYAYEDTTYSEAPSIIVEGKFSCINQKESVKLNSVQVDSLEKILFGYKGGVSSPADCYEPRHTIVFYKNGKAFAFIELCFACAGMKVHGGFNFLFCDEQWAFLKDFFKSVGITYFGPNS